MTLAPWRSPLSRALHRNRALPQSRYFQLATVTPEGLPTNRTVVFRSFYEDTNYLQVVTDSRSDKIADIQHQPWGEACWYFSKTREQFRLGGKLTLIGAAYANSQWQNARQTAWEKLSDSARSQFTWPNPGEKRVEDKDAFSSSPSADTEPPSNFCLLLLDPQKVDHLELKGEPQNRCIYLLGEDLNWTSSNVNP